MGQEKYSWFITAYDCATSQRRCDRYTSEPVIDLPTTVFVTVKQSSDVSLSSKSSPRRSLTEALPPFSTSSRPLKTA